MNLDPAYLFSSLMIGMIGFVCFRYGKGTGKMVPLLGGVAMFIYPYFISSVLLMWLVEAGLLAAMFFMRER